jgi:hypothetical protein
MSLGAARGLFLFASSSLLFSLHCEVLVQQSRQLRVSPGPVHAGLPVVERWLRRLVQAHGTFDFRTIHDEFFSRYRQLRQALELLSLGRKAADCAFSPQLSRNPRTPEV